MHRASSASAHFARHTPRSGHHSQLGVDRVEVAHDRTLCLSAARVTSRGSRDRETPTLLEKIGPTGVVRDRRPVIRFFTPAEIFDDQAPSAGQPSRQSGAGLVDDDEFSIGLGDFT
jgi:hypothetical protein